MAERRLYIAGNWKMNLTLDGAVALADDLKRRIGRIRGVDVAVAPSLPFIAAVAKRLEGERIAVGSQDLQPGTFGAFTGAVSGPQLKSAGASFVIVGHSERRHVFGETDAIVAKKLRATLEHDLDAILCIGEKLEERDGGHTFEVCERQLEGALAGLTDLARITLAYEPVWAIGTGRNATPAQAQEVHRFVRDWIRHRFGGDAAEAVRIQYGGSVKADNAASLLSCPDVDGALVGGAALDPASFSAIVTSQGSH